MSDALSTQKPQTVFTRRDLNQKSRDMLSSMQAFLKSFDAREPQYMPRRKINPIGAALLMHREIEALDAKRYQLDVDVEALDAMDDADKADIDTEARDAVDEIVDESVVEGGEA